LLLCGAAPRGNAGYINWRLFLEEAATETPLYANFCFRNPTDVGNRYGIYDIAYALALNHYFAAGAVQNPVMCFTRFPSGPARAHLYGGGVAAESTASQLVAALTAEGGTTLNQPSDGGVFSTCFGSGLGCDPLTGISDYNTLAKDIAADLNDNPPHLGVITASIQPKTTTFVVPQMTRGFAFQVSSITSGGPLEVGSWVCSNISDNPCLEGSASVVGQITAQQLWQDGTAGGAGWYTFLGLAYQTFSGPTTLYATYGLLTVQTQNSGFMSVPSRLEDGRGFVSSNTLVEACISGCTSTPYGHPAPDGSTWAVDLSQTVATEKMTVTAPLLSLNWVARTGVTVNWGFFFVGQDYVANWTNSNLGYATGTAASILGLSKGSAGYTSGGYTVPHSSIFLSTPGGIVTDPSAWLNNFQQTHSGAFSSCELTYTNPGLITAVQNWGAANGTPCPSGWINNPACTPRAGYFPSTCTGAAGPNISNISSNTPSSTSATITWTTSIPASTQVMYGTTLPYGSESPIDTTLVTSHSVTLVGLSARTTYNYRVQSAANGVLTRSKNRSFATAASP